MAPTHLSQAPIQLLEALLLALAFIAATAVLSGTSVQQGVSRIIDQDQPAVLIATEVYKRRLRPR